MPGAAAQVAANPWDMGGLDPLPLLGPNNMQVGRSEALQQRCYHPIFQTGAKPKSAVENLLGEHSALVNLDSLVDNKKTGGGAGGGAGGPPAKNPFAEQPNPFQAAAAPKPSMNQLRGGNQVSPLSCAFLLLFSSNPSDLQPSPQIGGGWPNQTTNPNTDINPFF